MTSVRDTQGLVACDAGDGSEAGPEGARPIYWRNIGTDSNWERTQEGISFPLL